MAKTVKSFWQVCAPKDWSLSTASRENVGLNSSTCFYEGLKKIFRHFKAATKECAFNIFIFFKLNI